jgi:dipeptidase D
MKDVYLQTFGRPVGLVAVHTGLETSVVGVSCPGMDMVSLGPTLRNAHSPDEQLEIASVARVYTLLVETLKRIPPK